MGIFNKLTDYFSLNKKEELNIKKDYFFNEQELRQHYIYNFLKQEYTTQELLNNVYIYKSIDYIANNILKLDYNTYNSKGEIEEKDIGNLKRLLNNQMMRTIIANYLIEGNCYIEILRQGDFIYDLQIINSNNIIFHNEKDGKKYNLKREEVAIKAEDGKIKIVNHKDVIKLINKIDFNKNIYRGDGYKTILTELVKKLKLIDIFNENKLKGKNKVTNLLKPNIENISTEEREHLETTIASIASSLSREKENSNNSTIILPTGVEFERITAETLQEDFGKTREYIIAEILTLFGLNQQIFGLRDAITHNSTVVLNNIVFESTIEPIIITIQDAFSSSSLFKGKFQFVLNKNVFNDFNEIINAVTHGIITIEEAREIYGLKKEDNNKKNINTGSKDINDIINLYKDSKKNNENEKKNAIINKIENNSEKFDIDIKKHLKNELLRGLFKEYDTTIINLLLNALNEEFLTNPEEIINIKLENILKENESKLFKILTGLPFSTLIVNYFNKGALTAKEELGLKSLSGREFKKLMKKQINEQFKRLNSDAILNKKEEFYNKLIKLNKEGKGVLEIKNKLLAEFDFDPSSVERIVRTELIEAENMGKLLYYKKEGGIKNISWYTTISERTCPYCYKMNGKVVGINENFYNLGDEMSVEDKNGKVKTLKFNYRDIKTPPLHPNCRCTILPEIKEE